MSKLEILRGNDQFRLVISSGMRVSGRLVRAVYLSQSGRPSSLRIGITVPRSLGGAVERNRLKRLLREAIRKGKPKLHAMAGARGLSLDIIFRLRAIDVSSIRRGFLQKLEKDVQSVCDTLEVQLNRKDSWENS